MLTREYRAFPWQHPQPLRQRSCCSPGHDLRRLLNPGVAIEALRETYTALADNRGDQGRSVGFMIQGGSIHVKSGLLPGSHLAFASKVNVNLPDNWNSRRLPTIQGVVVVSDAKDGRPLAIMESITLTGIRTAATAALAAEFGASKDSKTRSYHWLRSPGQVSTRSTSSSVSS